MIEYELWRCVLCKVLTAWLPRDRSRIAKFDCKCGGSEYFFTTIAGWLP